MSDSSRLLDLIALKSKEHGIATLPELHEACGLDVEAMYALLKELQDARCIVIEGEYPFERIRVLTPTEGPA